MKQLNEVARMQQLAGILTENSNKLYKVEIDSSTSETVNNIIISNGVLYDNYGNVLVEDGTLKTGRTQSKIPTGFLFNIKKYPNLGKMKYVVKFDDYPLFLIPLEYIDVIEKNNIDYINSNEDNKDKFYNWVKKHKFYHVSELKNKEKILKNGLKYKENFIYSDNDEGDILDITNQGQGIVVFEIDSKFIQSIPIYPDPEMLENDLLDVASNEAHMYNENELEELYDFWVSDGGDKFCTWFFTLRKIPPQYLKIHKIYED